MVTVKWDRARRFQQGLRLEIQQHMAVVIIGTYSEMLEAVQCIEQVVEEKKEEQFWTQKCPIS